MARLETVALADFCAAAIRSERLRQLLRYWTSKRRGAALPRRRDIDPVDMAAVLPIVMLLETIGATERFRFRLFGTECVFKFEQDLTGRELSEVGDHGGVLGLADDCLMCVSKRVPVLTRSVTGRGARADLNFERLLLPLAGAGDAVAMILAGMDTRLSGASLIYHGRN